VAGEQIFSLRSFSEQTQVGKGRKRNEEGEGPPRCDARVQPEPARAQEWLVEEKRALFMHVFASKRGVPKIQPREKKRPAYESAKVATSRKSLAEEARLNPLQPSKGRKNFPQEKTKKMTTGEKHDPMMEGSSRG